MNSKILNPKTVIEMYDDNKSIHQIAEYFDTYTNKIRRLLIKNGKEIRGHSEAQKIAMESGRASHPTKGKKRSEDVKSKIAKGVHKHWSEMDDDEYEKRVKAGKDNWEAMTEYDREKLKKLASEGMRKAAKEGSKIEKFVKKYLTDMGYVVIFHQKNLIPSEKLEVDLYIPELKTVIEIDGPSHFLPIWGEESLKKHIKSDAQKSGLVLANGYCMLRVKNIQKNISNIQMKNVAEQILKKLKEISNKFPPKNQRYIQLEVT